MSAVLEIEDYWVTVSDKAVTLNFKALVEDAVQVAPGTRYEPAEFGAAYCIGSVDLGSDECPPSEDNEADQLLMADLVQNWELPEPDDFDMMSSFGTKWHCGL